MNKYDRSRQGMHDSVPTAVAGAESTKKKPSRKKAPIVVPDDSALVEKPSLKQTQLALRKFVENFYDIQERRLQVESRTTPKAEGAEIVLFESDKVRLDRATSSLKDAEADALKDIENALKRIPFYVNILSDKNRFKGIGPTMAGVILSSFDIHRSDTVSKMWAFAGLAPEACKRCLFCHSLVEPMAKHSDSYVHIKQWRTQVLPECKAPLMTNDINVWMEQQHTYDSGRSMKPKKGEKLKYNKWLRSKLCGVLGEVLIKCNSPWRKFYDDYKHRKISAGWGHSDMHRHRAAIRYMIKMLLKEIYVEWRTIEGLPVREPYEVEYLGRKHHESSTPEAKAGTAGKDMEEMRIEEELRMATS